MKNSCSTLAKAVAVIALVSASGLATAGGTTILNVTAGITGICKFNAASTPLGFGSIDPSGTADATATANVLYKCTNGTPATSVVATGGLTRTMTDAGSHTLAYTLSYTGDTQTGAGFGTGKDLTLAVTGTITAAQYQNAFASASATAYADNVTLTVSP